VSPQAQRSQVGDRRDDRNVDLAGLPHPAEHLARARIGRDDHVGSGLVHQPLNRSPGQKRDQPGDGAADRAHAEDQAVLEIEQPLQPARAKRRFLIAEPLQHTAGLGEGVTYLHARVGPCSEQAVTKYARRQVVALADPRRQDERSGRGLQGGHGDWTLRRRPSPRGVPAAGD
jgi:hypothetical protein